jgi:hypothetical protein
MKATLLASLGLSLATCQLSAILRQRELKILPDSFTELNYLSQDSKGDIKEDSTDISVTIEIGHALVSLIE